RARKRNPCQRPSGVGDRSRNSTERRHHACRAEEAREKAFREEQAEVSRWPPLLQGTARLAPSQQASVLLADAQLHHGRSALVLPVIRATSDRAGALPRRFSFW